MPITVADPFKGRQYPGEVILQAVRWYLRYPLAYEHVAELLAERGLAIDASCVWRCVQAYAPELNRRCQPDRGQLNFRRGQLEFPGHRRVEAIQVGDDLYGERSAGETALAADAEVIA